VVQVPLLWTLPACSPRVLVLSLTERRTRPSRKGDGPHQTHVTETNPTRPVPSRPRHVSSPHYLAQLGRANILGLPRACLRPPPWRRLGGRSRACRWRGRPSSAWRRRWSALVYPISGVTRATAASATARTRAAPGHGRCRGTRSRSPWLWAVARHALLVCAWPPMDGAFLGLAPTHIPCATLMNANFKSIQVQTYSDPTHSVHKVAITRAWTPLPRS